MKFYFIFIIFYFLFSWVAHAQIVKTFPVLDTRIEKVKRPTTTQRWADDAPNKLLTSVFFADTLAFETGDTQLNLAGEAQLDQFIIQIDNAIQTFRKTYPTALLVLKISIAEDGKKQCVLCARRTNEIYQYLTERLVQAGNVQVQKEVIKVKTPTPQHLLSTITVDNLLGR